MGTRVVSGSRASAHSKSLTSHAALVPALNSALSIPVEAIKAELERVLSSEAFSGSERLCQFLRFVVEQSICGQADALKEWLLGVRVFGRSQSFDPRVDAIVRVEAGRLRTKLADYYETEGRNDRLLIQIRKGTYAPVFHERSSMARQTAPGRVRGFEPMANHQQNYGLASILVLPFVNLSADADNEYFSDGLTEEVISGLTRIQGLRVIARSTAFQYKGQAQDIPRIGAELNVSVVLEGSVRRIGDRLRISARLIDPRNCLHLWSRTFERRIKDIFAIQQEIAEEIGGIVRGQVSAARPLPETMDATGVEAYDLYLRAMYFEGKRTIEGLSKGLEHLQLAAELNPECAPIYARLANSYALRAFYGLEAPNIAMKRARDATSRALQIDDTLAQAHAAKGFVSALFDWDWPAAGMHFRRALELNPGVPEIHLRYAVFYLSALGNTEDALSHIQQAEHLDPMSIVPHAAECAVLVHGRKYEAAATKGRRTIELEPTYYPGHLYLSRAYLMQGMPTESIRAAEQAVRLSSESPAALAALGMSYALAGQMDQARNMVGRMQQLPYVPPVYVSSVYAEMGEIDKAFHWLARAERERSPSLVCLRAGIWARRLRSDPRFNALARAVGVSCPARSSGA
jgi:TolB-like protein/Flp pilus assembly protein TadD